MEIHCLVLNAHILKNDKDEVFHHAHASRGLPSHDATSTQWTRKVLQHRTEPCNDMASGGSPGAYYVDGLVFGGHDSLGILTRSCTSVSRVCGCSPLLQQMGSGKDRRPWGQHGTVDARAL